MISYVWTGILLLSFVTALCLGRGDVLASAIPQGTEQSVTLCLTMVGLLGLWSGILELMQVSGLVHKLTALLRPLLCRLFPNTHTAARDAIAANLTANLLGLSNAATPLGLQAADEMLRTQGESDELLRLIALNTTSIQLVPTTVASVRASLGARNPFDILPAVWAASFLSVSVCMIVASICIRLSGGIKH